MRTFLLLAALILAAPATNAAEWDVETVLAHETASSWQVSPDGKQAVWVKRFLDEDGKKYRLDLFLTDLAPGDEPAEPRRLTRADADDRAPRWSPDGARIAFLSARGDDDEGPQVWLLHLAGGEPERVTEIAGGVRDYRWLDDGRLLLLAGEPKTLRDTQLEEAGDATIVVGDAEHEPPARLFTFDLEKQALRRVAGDDQPVQDFEPSPDGRWAVGRVSRDLHFDYDHRTPPRVVLWDLETGATSEPLPPEMEARGFVWDRESRGFWFDRPAASDSTDLYVSLELLGWYDLAAGRWEAVDIEWERGLGYFGKYATEKGLLADLADGTLNRLLHVERGRRGWKPRRLDRPARGITQLEAMGPDGKTVVYGRTTASEPMRWYAARLDGDKLKDAREVLRLNAFLDELPLARTETVRWAGARGDSVEGVLYYPHDWQADERHPLVVMLHGGPTWSDMDYYLETWGGSPALMCARGAFVLKVNYHGSYGYGLEWLESIKGRYYELEVPDILAGVDYLVDRGLVDESRLGVQGWSNGAILGIALCIESGERFSVLDAGAGDVNWISDYGNCAFGAGFDNAYLGGPPWEMPQVYVDKSPLFRIEELKVPTIIFFGTEDVNVPTEQGWQLYRALQQIGATPVRFLLFPGEDHSLMNPVHRRRQIEEEMAWFDRWLFDRHEEVNEAFQTGSPLDLALRLADAARVDDFYGELVDDVLVPELIEHEGLLVGRFEVTRAQWAVFAGEAAPAPGAGDLPATGMSADEARAYCRWLAGRTGLDCRLPTREELEGLQGLAGGGNTLAWWAGYAPNCDDATRLDAKVRELEVNRSLLMPAGSFAPAGETGLYDLGGNAAEWAEDEGGAVALGLSAVAAPDDRAEPVPPPPAYVGLRVVAPVTADAEE
ncbi:MAG: prolyl oligopeptidase family serine peptidase [Candidatus Krumholzibacteriota bacterium]|nr:prolyl oligopeptidase family serine peptidase [Candidatus Krumholzibacteriota bacterium]